MTSSLKRFSVLALLITMLPAFAMTRTMFEPTLTQTSAASALHRGYRTGYSDGYMTGYHDTVNGAAREFQNKDDYTRANRAYDATYGTLDEYRDGYRQGFEIGYDAGYGRRTFNSTVPAGLSRRASSNTTDAGVSTTTSADVNGAANNNSAMPRGNVVEIPGNTVLLVELLNSLSTEASQRGDAFEARIIEPQGFQGATVSGHIARVKRPGKVRGNAELQLSFDDIRLADNRTAKFDAQVVEVIPASGNGVGKVDTEGGVQGKNSRKDDVAKIGAGAGIGAIIGAIAGGGGGAAVGAVIGGAVGTGGVLASHGKEIYLPRGQQLRIRTTTSTRYE